MVRVDALIAVDVAILLPRHVADTARTLSAGLPPTESQGLVLDATRLPHITLTQQFVPAEELSSVMKAIERVIRGRAVLPLQITGAGRGTRAVWMRIERTAPLDDLHRALMDVLLPFERRGGKPSAFADGDARPEDLQWVSGFRGNSSYERFTPHVTLGHGSRLPRVEPISFDAEVVALCHLGRFCTCRAVLRSWSLIGSAAEPDSPGTRHPSA